MSHRIWSATDIPTGFAILVGFNVAGDLISYLSPVKAPGAVIGMVLLTLVLAVRRQTQTRFEEEAALPSKLDRVADAVIANMGLMFIPAGVGVVAQLALVSANLAALVVAVIISTIAALMVTGWVFTTVEKGRQAHSATEGER